VPLFALRGEKDLGIGDVAALREFIDWVAEVGFKLVQLLPINEIGADNSPYNAISAMAIEPTTLHLAPNSERPPSWRRKVSPCKKTEAALVGKGVFEFFGSRGRTSAIGIPSILRTRVRVVARLRTFPRPDGGE